VVEAADAMVKPPASLVGYEKIGARVTVIVQGRVSEVQASVAAGVDAADRSMVAKFCRHTSSRPHENLEYVPIRYTEAVDQFRV